MTAFRPVLQFLVRPQGASQDWISILDFRESLKLQTSSLCFENKNSSLLLVPLNESNVYTEAHILEHCSQLDMDVDVPDSSTPSKDEARVKVKIASDETEQWIEIDKCIECGKSDSPTESEIAARQDCLLKLCKRVQKRNKTPADKLLRIETQEMDERCANRNQEGPKGGKKQVGKVGKKRNVEKDDLSLSQQVWIATEITIERPRCFYFFVIKILADS